MTMAIGDRWMVVLHPSTFSLTLGFVFLLGGYFGFLVGRRRDAAAHETPNVRQSKQESKTRGNVAQSVTKCKNGKPKSTVDSREGNIDGPTMVLQGSLDLMSSKWGSPKETPLDNANVPESAVVEYLSPEKMAQMLFSRVLNDGSNVSNTLRLDEHVKCDNKFGEEAHNLQNKNESIKGLQPESFVTLLSLIQKYSVDTSHPYFFNQLFGSLDPIALAAEIVALSVNTSVYTYETAPVFTLLEREVMNQIGKLVFMDDNSEGDCDEFEGEGLMIPGGSLANLTAMHAARHRWKVMNGFNRYTSDGGRSGRREDDVNCWEIEEEKKFEDSCHGSEISSPQRRCSIRGDDESLPPSLVAFVSSEAHYSFSKSARVLGMDDDDLIVIPTHPDGRMDVKALEKSIEKLEIDANDQGEEGSLRKRRKVPFFVACTAGSTVRGSFDEVAEIVRVCRAYESRGTMSDSEYERSIWVHVDGAWGGSAIFSSRPEVRSATHMDEIRHADSFTFNPHKMLGAPQQTTAFIVRHRNALRNANAAGAKYLFDPRKNGAEYDLGDLSYTCGRRTDAVKLWAMWKYYGRMGLGARVDQKVDELELFVREINRRPSFALACKPWPFNVNFFYFPPRIREELRVRGLLAKEDPSCGGNDHFIEVPDDIAEDLANVSVTLKLRLHEAGEMIIPYQPLNNQKADCFRLVLAGKKNFGIDDIHHVLDTMEKYGADL